MTRVCVICEGQTELAFVKEVLEPHLRAFGLETIPSLLKSRPGRQGGGGVSVERVAQHVKHFHAHFAYLTTLLDFYGFQGKQDNTRHSLEQNILEEAKRQAGRELTCFRPYVQMHEFEGLLFSDVQQFEWVLLDGWSQDYQQKLQVIRDDFDTPEMINDGPETAPSKRLRSIFGGAYDKVEYGSIIVAETGLQTIREQCPNFNEWLTWLESLGNDTGANA